MTFEEVLNQAIAMLQRRQRVSYRALKRQFGLDDQYLEDLTTEIVDVLRLAQDEDGKMLVWIGGGAQAIAVGEQQAYALEQPGVLTRLTPAWSKLSMLKPNDGS